MAGRGGEGRGGAGRGGVGIFEKGVLPCAICENLSYVPETVVGSRLVSSSVEMVIE